MTSDISLTRRVATLVQCATLCGVYEICYVFEYDGETNLCHVFNGFQPFSGNEVFPHGQRSVYKDIEGCVRSGYILFRDGHLCFKLFRESRTWGDAFTACQNDGGRLIVLQTSKQIEYILNVTEISGIRYHWIGLTDRKFEGEWTYIDDKGFNETIWPSVNFNNKCQRYNLDPNEADCGALNSNSRHLSDCHCNVTRDYICERPQLV
ncbi:C-type lectin domain family 4 member M-like [Mizuhopecten yessoensis]|uniref:CD209 n=1 Tax=Mizuhopecten yessoensis TaxID=6573 RepID=A0A210QI44_MIZYE|nr:C-type lectin domain family 4 member M-like [Mizuhopecten yessoensis]OWF48369.1 CD209 [Mizuhopecten yessoensis]